DHFAKTFVEATKDKKTAKSIATVLAQSEDYSSAVPILEILGVQARPALSLLIRVSLGDEKDDPNVASAKKTMEKIKPTSAELILGLTRALNANLSRVQVSAAKRIVEIGKPAIPALLEAANAPVTDGQFYDCYAEARLAQIDALITLGADKKE